MSIGRVAVVLTGGLLLTGAAGCRFVDRGPSDDEIRASVRKSPPSPPTLGPTYLAEVGAVEVLERGRYNVNGNYWPVRVRVRGSAKIRIANPLQLALVANARTVPPEAVDFVEEARFQRDSFGKWTVAYHYDAAGPGWRLRGGGAL